MTAPAGASPRQYFGRGAFIVVGAALFTLGLHSFGVLDRWENDNLDRLLRTKATQQSGNLVLVTIDDDDYATLFDGESPIRQDRVTELLVQISRAGPRVIGVDLDTSHWKPDEPSALDGLTVPIVWARDAWKQDSKDHIGKVRGRDTMPGLCTGVPAMRLDADGIVRRTYTVWNVGDDSLPSFPVLLAERYQGLTGCKAHVPEDHSHTEEPINFLSRGYGFKRFTANAVLSLAKSATWEGDPDFDDRIVLLGGTYRAARDQYVTPVGLMDGVEVIAHVTQNHLSGNRVGVAGHVAHFVAEVVVGFTLLVILFFLAAALEARGISSARFSSPLPRVFCCSGHPRISSALFRSSPACASTRRSNSFWNAAI